MAIDLEIEIDTARPPAGVFAELVAVERWPEWLIASGVIRVDRADTPAGADATAAGASPLAVGTKLRIEQRVAGRAATLEARVTAFDIDRRFALEGRDADGVKIAIDASLIDRAPGSRLRWHLTIGLPFRYRVFESMARPQVERAARLDLEAFRRRLDAVAEG
jgi:uncharacterized protein YndB with AHSA1/START domain